MFNVESDEFRPTERASEADEHQRLIADAGHIVAADRKELLDVSGGESSRLTRRLSMGATDASQGLSDSWVPRAERLLGDAMSARNGGHPSPQSRQRVTTPGVGQVDANDLGRRWHRVEMALDTPRLEVGQLSLVGAERRRCIDRRLVDLRSRNGPHRLEAERRLAFVQTPRLRRSHLSDGTDGRMGRRAITQCQDPPDKIDTR